MFQLQKAHFLAIPPPEKEMLSQQTFRVELLTPKRKTVCKIRRLLAWPPLPSPERGLLREQPPRFTLCCVSHKED